MIETSEWVPRYGEFTITVKISRRGTATERSIDSPEAGCGGCHHDLVVLFRTMAESIERNWNAHLARVL